jgi:putative drug exporter of the RND superfamily
VTGGLYRLGRLCVRHRWIVLAVWIVVFAGLAVGARSVGSDLSDNLSLPGTDSQKATDLLEARLPDQANGTAPVTLRAPKGAKVTDSKYADGINATVSALRKDPDVRSVTSPLATAGAAQVSKGGTVAYISVNPKTSASDMTTDDAQRIVDLGHSAEAAGLQVAFGSYIGQKVSKPDTHDSEVIGLGMAVIVLLFTFGTVVAMGLPIITALMGLVSGLSIITFISHIAVVPTVAPTLATMIGLGVGIDYSLFVVTRHFEQRRDGMDTMESIARSTATSGGAIVFAGTTVIIALLSLAVVQIPLVTTLGYTAALVVLVAMTAAITLLPALLAIAGDRIDRLALPHKAKSVDSHPHGWRRWGEFVTKHPIPSAVTALVILGALAWPVLDLYLGQQDNGALPTDTESRQAYDAMAAGFGVGANAPLLIAVDMTKKPAEPDPAAPPSPDGQPAGPATDPRLTHLSDDLKSTKGVASVTPPLLSDSSKAAVMTVTPTTGPADRATETLVRTLRDDTIPRATKDADMTADVGGTTAGYVDLADEISGGLVLTIAVVVLLSILLLTLAFRSIVIPLTAGLMNLISIGAAFGVVTAVFEKGWGIGLVGLDSEVAIVSYVPLMMFAILFGLSMDYEVFLITHIREAWRREGDNRLAIVDGIANTGRVITSAALIMVSVFFAFIINGDPTVKQFGVGMGVAVAVDATLVRCLLVPAVMTLLGNANWWFPGWLDRLLPNFSIEGEEFFDEQDRKAALPARPAPVLAAGSASHET